MKLRSLASTSAVVVTITLLASACAHASRNTAAPSPRPGETDVAVAPPLATVERAMLAAVIDTIAARLPDSTSLCLRLLGGPSGPTDPDEAFLAALRTRQRPVRARDCPRTYASMIVVLDSLGRPLTPSGPRGYVDPYTLVVGRPQFEHPGYAWVLVRESQGTDGHDYLCAAQSYDARTWASCRVVTTWVS